ncbi:class I SAM-dependent methyltransferase [Methylomonas sp. TEB]|uniref:class I SAM-dependent methyltransferase n=1 Tax=Methylomonas sp. TEB TaxID=3398229 RepID=UPI0039F4F55C
MSAFNPLAPVDTQRDAWNKVAGEISFSLEPDLDKLTTLISKNAKILDYGCGYGRITSELHARGYGCLTGVDTSIEMIRRGLKHYPTLDLRYIDSYEIPADIGKFDVILFCAVLTCIPNKAQRRKIIELAYELLNKSGIIYCVEFHQSENIQYSATGTFIASFNVEMKHFMSTEITDELSLFDEISHFVTEATTVSGAKTHAIHYFGKKL